ncbi:hypothetical protein BGZ63DRAFT_396787 [Mariannaea sp. PMI_226]|nr:hypothetical protein BGZ63DRAFT_396787 [Mariannaea sp. PMI_226]
MALLKILVLAAAAIGVAQAGPCKPSTTSTAPPAATTTACVPGLKNPPPAGKCNLKGFVTSGNAVLGFSAAYDKNLDDCFLGCSLTPGCTVIHLIVDGVCSFYGPADTLTTDGNPNIAGAVYDMSCYNFCTESTTYST